MTTTTNSSRCWPGVKFHGQAPLLGPAAGPRPERCRGRLGRAARSAQTAPPERSAPRPVAGGPARGDVGRGATWARPASPRSGGPAAARDRALRCLCRRRRSWPSPPDRRSRRRGAVCGGSGSGGAVRPEPTPASGHCRRSPWLSAVGITDIPSEEVARTPPSAAPPPSASAVAAAIRRGTPRPAARRDVPRRTPGTAMPAAVPVTRRKPKATRASSPRRARWRRACRSRPRRTGAGTACGR